MADGFNVYFATYDTLVTQDHNGPFLKFYDARTAGGFPPESVTQPCVAADECHGAGSNAPPAPGIASDGDLGASEQMSSDAALEETWEAAPRKKHKAHHKKHRGRHGNRRPNNASQGGGR